MKQWNLVLTHGTTRKSRLSFSGRRADFECWRRFGAVNVTLIHPIIIVGDDVNEWNGTTCLNNNNFFTSFMVKEQRINCKDGPKSLDHYFLKDSFPNT